MPRRIVLIEDDVDASLVLEKLLVKRGHHVYGYHDAHSVFESHFECPDLFILDNSLPTIDGVALCKYLRLQSRMREIPIIVISGNHDVKEKALRAGASAFIGKPFQKEALLRTIDQMILDSCKKTI